MAEAAARVEESLLQHAGDLARGVGLGIDVASRALTALPLLLPAFMPSQRGLPTLLTRLAEILRRPSGPDDVEGQAEVGIPDSSAHLQVLWPSIRVRFVLQPWLMCSYCYVSCRLWPISTQ